MSHGDERDDNEPFPLPPKLPTSTEPHPGPSTGPPEADTPEMASLAALHSKVDNLIRSVGTLAGLVRKEADEELRASAIERDQNHAIALIERRLAIAGIPEAPESNGHASG